MRDQRLDRLPHRRRAPAPSSPTSRATASWQAAPQAHQSFAVSRASQTISFTSTPPSGATVGGTYAVAATASSGLAVGFSSPPRARAVCTISGSTVSFTASGTCTVERRPGRQRELQPGAAGAAVASPSPSASRAPQTITFTSAVPGNFHKNDTYAVSAVASSGLPVTFTVDPSSSGYCSISGHVVTGIAKGSCKIWAYQLGNSQYYPALASQTFTVK